jgi:hypothetical protein
MRTYIKYARERSTSNSCFIGAWMCSGINVNDAGYSIHICKWNPTDVRIRRSPRVPEMNCSLFHLPF